VPVVEAQTFSAGDRDRGLERLRALTIAGAFVAAALTVAFSIMAAAGIPGHTDLSSASTFGGDDSFQNQPQPFSGRSSGHDGGGRPVVVTGGS
jgi:hypothetical protein